MTRKLSLIRSRKWSHFFGDCLVEEGRDRRAELVEGFVVSIVVCVLMHEAPASLDRGRFDKVEWRHVSLPGPPPAKAANSRSVKCFSISLALDFSTGCPILPSFPVKVALIEY